MQLKNIQYSKKDLEVLCQKNGVERLAFFGSILRDDFKPDSDIDIIVKFKDGSTPGLFGFINLRDELEKIFGGRKVDLTTYKGLKEGKRKQEILDSAEVQYDKAS